MSEQTVATTDDEAKPEGAQFREKLETATKQNVTLTSERDTLKRENAILKAGLGDLSEKRITALLAAHEGDLTADAIRATAVDLGFAEPPEVDEAAQAADAAAAGQQRIANAANGAQGSQQAGVITPEGAGDWPHDKLMRLHEQHPEAYDALLRGETVTGLIFT